MKLNCVVCGKEYVRYGKQVLKSKTCSFECLGKLNSGVKNTTCEKCGCNFHLKESAKKRYKRAHGYFCSTKCVADFRKEKYLGEENPNFRKQVERDSNGYKLAYIPKFGRIKLHHKVAFEFLEIKSLPKGYCIHHRDCNIDNNDTDNLVILSLSDHRWLHKQFGNATLWAYRNNRIQLEELLKWTNNIEKAKILLPLSILDQKKAGVFKLDELLENLEEGNQQPSFNLND